MLYVAKAFTRFFDGKWLFIGYETVHSDESLTSVWIRIARQEGRRTEDVKVEIVDR